ncbi:MOS1T transposase, partial [Pseudoatta argentina]
MSIFVPNKVYLRGILLPYFIQKKSAAEAHRILVQTYDDNALSDTACRDWFRRFKNNDFELEDKERSGAPKTFQDKELEQLLDEDPSQTLSELEKILQIDESTVSKRLKGLGMIQKQGHWVSLFFLTYRIQLKACISPCGGFVICGSEDSVLNIWNLETGKLVAKYTNDERNSSKTIVTCVDYHPYDHVLAYSIFGNPTSVNVLRYNKDASGNDVGLHFMEDASQSRGNEVILNALSCPRQSKSNVAGRKEMPPLPHHLTADHTIIQIENNDYGRLWTMPHYSREMERNWKKSWDRLHNIIEKIDSILFGNSMFEDVAKQSSSANERCGSWTNNASNIDLQRDILLDDAVNSIRSYDGNNTQSSFTTVSKSLDHSSDFRNSAVALKKTDTSLHISSPDSTGTYTVEMSNFNKNVEVALTAEEKDSVQTIGSDNSRISNVTFLIENERA